MRRCFAIHRNIRAAFTLLELMVVLLIVALLVVLLLPAVASARRASRATKCLSNVHQWSEAYQAYLSNNHGVTIPDTVITAGWWEVLARNGGGTPALLLCPEASEPLSHQGQRGSASRPWVWLYPSGLHVGSYGFNRWLFLPESHNKAFFHLPTKQPSTVAVLGDSTYPYTNPDTLDAVPTDFNEPGPGGELKCYCLNRHGMAVNVAFLDGHAERVPLAGLWKLKWSADSVSRDVQVPSR